MLVFLLAAASCAVASTDADARLPRSIIPTSMLIDLVVGDPNNLALAYSGSVSFQLKVSAPSSTITLHSHLLKWAASNCNVKLAKTAESVAVQSVSFNASTQFAVLQLARQLTPVDGMVELSISDYAAKFNSGDNGGSGFFLSSNTYSPGSLRDQPMPRKAKDEGGWRRFPNAPSRPWLSSSSSSSSSSGGGGGARVLEGGEEDEGGTAVEMMYGTQFEETDARRAFPCFDEPLFKVHVTTTISVPAGKGLVALANTMEVGPPTRITMTRPTIVAASSSQKSSSNASSSAKATAGVVDIEMEKFTFKETKHPMSSYLVAFAVGKFDYVEANDSGVRIRIYTPPGMSAYGTFALDFTVKVLKFYSESWGFPYSDMNDKMDQISVPSVVDNAMENWGLLTYFPSFLLVDSLASPSLPSQQLVAQVTAHEISHQWFGDTITNEWWSSEYLQEGYARLWQYVSVDAIFPEWDVFNSIILGSPFGDIGFFGWPFNRGMDSDYDGKLPAPVVPDNQQASSTAFYEKGAAVNRMFSNYLGQDVWFSVLKKHLHKYEWSNPELPNLLESFQDHLPPSHANFSKKMASWLEQPGMPLVTLSIVDVGGGGVGGGGAYARRKQCGLSVSQKPSSTKIDGSQTWWIPLHVQLTHAGAAGNVSDGATSGGGGSDGGSGSQQWGSSDTLFVDVGVGTKEITVPLNQKGCDATSTMIYGNFNFSAFVLVNYTDPRQWKHLVAKMAAQGFPKIDRQQLQKQLTYLAALESGTDSSPSLGHLTELVRMYCGNSNTKPASPGVLSLDSAGELNIGSGSDYLLHMVDELALMGRQLLCRSSGSSGLRQQYKEFRTALVVAFETIEILVTTRGVLVQAVQEKQVKNAATYWKAAFSDVRKLGCDLL